jgi:hypothetical protein
MLKKVKCLFLIDATEDVARNVDRDMSVVINLSRQVQKAAFLKKLLSTSVEMLRRRGRKERKGFL